MGVVVVALRGFLLSPRAKGSPVMDVAEHYRSNYERLRRLARRQRQRLGQPQQATLGTTALVHEAYLKLARRRPDSWKSTEHMVATAARAMRQVLVSYARARGARKRGGTAFRVASDVDWFPDLDTIDPNFVLELDEALDELGRIERRLVWVVECRVFGGLSLEESAQALGVSSSTVKRDWRVASDWLQKRLELERVT